MRKYGVGVFFLVVLSEIFTCAASAEPQWTWFSGSNTVNQIGVYGTKGVAAPGNVPGAREGSVSWIDSSGNLWLFGGTGKTSNTVIDRHLNDLWKFDGRNWTWVNGSNIGSQIGVYGTKGVAAPGNVPGGRKNSVSWIDSIGNLWLFGGYGFGSQMVNLGRLNDLWRFDGVNWTWVSGSNTVNQIGVYGTKGVAAPGNVPGMREESVSWIDGNDNLWLFGGEEGTNVVGSGHILNDLWKFDGGNWTWVSGSTNTVNQIGVYDTKGLAAPANVPGARYYTVSWIDSSGNLWLFGGIGNTDNTYGLLNDLWKFDGINWIWVSGSNTGDQNGVYGTKGLAAPGNVPGARWGSVSWIDSSGNLWIFGGIGCTYASSCCYLLNDLWKFDGGNWTWVSGSIFGSSGVYGTKGVAAPDNVPGSRQGSASWIDSSDKLWLFGGGGGYNSDALRNDLWKFDPSPPGLPFDGLNDWSQGHLPDARAEALFHYLIDHGLTGPIGSLGPPGCKPPFCTLTLIEGDYFSPASESVKKYTKKWIKSEVSDKVFFSNINLLLHGLSQQTTNFIVERATLTIVKKKGFFKGHKSGCLSLDLPANAKGNLEVAVPRVMLDAETGGKDEKFYIVVDGKEAKYNESKNADFRKLTIQIAPGVKKVQIFGNRVGPSAANRVGPSQQLEMPH